MEYTRASQQKEDMRQRRSKRNLTKALLELMEQKPYREISVVDICRQAMVHRTTFYAHFEDKDALFCYAFAQLRKSFWEKCAHEHAPGDWVEGALECFQIALAFLQEHRQIYSHGLGEGGAEMKMLQDAVAEDIICLLPQYGSDKQAMAQFFAGGMMALVSWWSDTGMSISTQQLCEILRKILMGVTLQTPTKENKEG